MLEELKEQIPSYAKDLKLNISQVLSTENSELSEEEMFLMVFSSALACKNDLLQREALKSDVADKENLIQGAREAVSIMGMNNIYYRFIHLCEDNDYASMPARLRMNVLHKSSVDKTLFEMACLAVSAITGCGLCISSHVKELEKAELSKTKIQDVIRVAALIHGLAATDIS